MDIIDAVADDKAAAAEQSELDNHDDGIASLQVRLETLLRSPTISPFTLTPDVRIVAERRLDQQDARLFLAKTAVSRLTSSQMDLHMVNLYQEELGEFKKELSEIRNEVLTIFKEGSDDLIGKVLQLDRQLFDLSVIVKCLLYNPDSTEALATSSTVPASKTRGVKLPKIDIPIFNGELLNWQSFWEQFCIAIHDRNDISLTDKLVYLRHSLTDGTAKSIIEGLSSSGDEYPKAIEALKNRFNCSRLLHHTHVKRIYEIPNVKEGSGRELRKLRDVSQQHLRALKAKSQEPSGPFIASLLELKLDQNTLFEWQKASQGSKDVTQYTELLEFRNLRAQASKSCSSDSKKSICDVRRQFSGNGRQITSFAANTIDSNYNCVVCKTETHPLYACDISQRIVNAATIVRSVNDFITLSSTLKRLIPLRKNKPKLPLRVQTMLNLDNVPALCS